MKKHEIKAVTKDDVEHLVSISYYNKYSGDFKALSAEDKKKVEAFNKKKPEAPKAPAVD